MSNISTRMQVYAAGAWHWVTDAWYNDGASWVELDTLSISGDGTLYPAGTWGGAAQTAKYDVPALGGLSITATSSTAVRVDWVEAASGDDAIYDLVLVFTNADHALPSYNTTVTIPASAGRATSSTHASAGQSVDVVTVTAHYRLASQGTVGSSSTASCTLP